MEAISADIRGFVLTGKETYLERYRAARLSVQEHKQRFVLTADNLISNDTFRRSSAHRRADRRSEYNINLFQTNGLAATAASISDGRGLAVTDALQAVNRDMRDEELRLLGLRQADAKRYLIELQIILCLGTLLGLSTTVAAGWSLPA